MQTRYRLLVLGLLLAFPTLALAQPGSCLLGSSATMGVYFPNLSSLNFTHPASPAIVSGPVEFGPLTLSNGSQFPWQFDIADTTMDVQHLGAFNSLGSAAFNGFVFTFAGLANSIASVSVNGSSTLVPFAVSSTSNSILVNYQGLGVIGPSVTNLNVTCVPEPGGLVAVVGIVLLGLRRVRWRMRSRN